MPVRDLGEVKGKDGGFGDVSAEYIDNGGDPSVEIDTQGDDQAKNFIFKFKNLVRTALSSNQIDSITSDEVVTSSNVLTGTGLTSLWSKIKEKFAPKSHTHSASDITSGELAAILIANGLITEDMLGEKCVTKAKLADHCVGQDQLEKTVWDSISRKADGLYVGSSGVLLLTFRNIDGWYYRLRVQNNNCLVQKSEDGSDWILA